MLFQSLTKISRFTGDAAGSEKSLRLLQAIVQVIAAYSVSAANAAPWLQARKQFALGRRYLRFFKFVDCFSQAFQSITSSPGIVGLFETGKWSCFGIYLLLESFTMMDAMGIWSTEWAPMLFVEAMKFWFYSICLSVLLTSTMAYLEIWKSPLPTKTVVGVEKRSEINTNSQLATRTNAMLWDFLKKILIDMCDLCIPGSVTGWIDVSSGSVGILSIISTVLASLVIWERIQKSP